MERRLRSIEHDRGFPKRRWQRLLLEGVEERKKPVGVSPSRHDDAEKRERLVQERLAAERATGSRALARYHATVRASPSSSVVSARHPSS
jgi:hypothetical protein